MKKVNIFGKSVPILMLVLLGVGMVSGALATFLSNTVEAEVTVESPIEQWISDGTGYSASPVSFSIYGGESVNLWVKTENKADVSITGEGENTITNWDGVTCADFSDVEARTDSGSGYTVWYNITSLCSVIDDYHVKFAYGPTPMIWSAGQIDETEIEVTFKPNALGVYTFTSEVVPV